MSTLYHRSILSSTKRYAQVVGMVGLLIAVAATSIATAQQYLTLEPKLTSRQANSLRGAVSKAMRDPAAFQANSKVIDNYFNNYYFRSMTLPTMQGQLGSSRENLFKQYIRPAKVPAAQKHLTDISLKAMRAIAKGNFHPPVRYNAVLILGMLDEKVANGIGVKPVPLPAGAKELLELLENDEFKGVKVPASLKLAALIGLERHVRFGVDPQFADRFTKASLAMIAQEEPPADLNLDVHHWIKCQAARVLARQFAQSPNAQVQAAFIGMIADPHMSLENRCCVAKLMTKITYDPAANLDVSATLGALGNLLNNVANDEAKQAAYFRDNALDDDVNNRNRDDENLAYHRRRLISRLHSISEGGRSLSKGLPDAGRQRLQGMLSTLDNVMEIADDKNSGDIEITTAVIDLKSQINKLVESWKPAEKAPAGKKEAPAEKASVEAKPGS